MAPRNTLFIMCDQLRHDYLSCAGHPTLETPNIDALAARGTRFSNAYCQSPICGPSRMSFYTGRYPSSHGATANFTPMRIGERNIGDHLRPLGVRPVLVGKTHTLPDFKGMKRLGIDPAGEVGQRHMQCGFDVFERDDGFHGDAVVRQGVTYNEYLKKKGYDGANPWHWHANSVDTQSGVRSGFFNDIAHLPARVADEDSETPYMTRRAMEFMEQDDGEEPWLLHLSYIKPHWPYIAPAPYNDMYGPDDVLPAVKSDEELEAAHPLFRSFIDRVCGRTFSREEARLRIIPTYMGLVKQIDDQLGLLFEFMDRKGLLEDTLIVFTSDHGDYLGDHWMGDKDFFHDPSVKIPLIIADPSPEADTTRSTVCGTLVEAVDLLPTFIEHYGGDPPAEFIDGTSLKPLLRGDASGRRDYVVSEYDYAMQQFRPGLGRKGLDSRTYMIRNERWKYMHLPGYAPVLFDLQNDPDELTDLGRSAEHASVRSMMHNLLADWSLQYRQRECWSEEDADAATQFERKARVLIGFWDESDCQTEDEILRPSQQPAWDDPAPSAESGPERNKADNSK